MVWKTKTVRGKGNEIMTDGKVKTGAKHILLRKGVFYPTFIFMLCAVITGIFKNEWLQAACKSEIGRASCRERV